MNKNDGSKRRRVITNKVGPGIEKSNININHISGKVLSAEIL